jgi:hypothetical protein
MLLLAAAARANGQRQWQRVALLQAAPSSIRAQGAALLQQLLLLHTTVCKGMEASAAGCSNLHPGSYLSKL